MSPALLTVRNLSVRFGGIVALDDVSFDVRKGEILGLVGPNGAGKTTLFNCLNRIYRPSSGEILFEGRSLLRTAPHQGARLGISRTFQNLALFPKMTVLENVMEGAHVRIRSRPFSEALRPHWTTREGNQARSIAVDLISFLNLDLVALKPAHGLPYGILKRVEIARALAAAPKLLLLDEPAAGLAQGEVSELQELLSALRAGGTVTQILVEHNMPFVMSVCDRLVVLRAGRKIADDIPDRVRTNPEVVEAYLGSVRT